MSDDVIHLLGGRPERTLSIDASKEAANIAYGAARRAQRHLCADMHLLEQLHRPAKVTYARLKSELRQAEQQRDRAQSVVDALNDCVNALESGAKGAGWQP